MNILAISGSLREASYNSGLLRAAQELAPEGMTIEIATLHGIPNYDGDLEAQGDPPEVASFKEAIREADGVLFATPEYNRGIPGGLKNAIDWASRPPRESVLDLKPVAIMGASTGIGGTTEAQRQLRAALGFPGAQTMEEPHLFVSLAATKFDEDGRLVDPATREELAQLLGSFERWCDLVREAILVG